MNIIISNNSNVPIYEQIKKAIITQILNEELKENDLLPSIRSLALDIRISVMTIKKAYDELETEGYIVTKHGKGSFVAPKNLELMKEEQQKEIESHLLQIIEIMNRSEITKEEILMLFEFLQKE